VLKSDSVPIAWPAEAGIAPGARLHLTHISTRAKRLGNALLGLLARSEPLTFTP
jgi:hypothetical protein